MLRRSWLKLVLGVAGLAYITQDWLVRVAHAQERPTRLPPPLGTVTAALGTGKPEAVASFILANPAAASSASVQDRGRMIVTMGFSPIGDSGIWRANNLPPLQGDYERAALSILRGIDRRPAELAEMITAVGGKRAIEQKIPQLRDPNLRTLATAAIKP